MASMTRPAASSSPPARRTPVTFGMPVAAGAPVSSPVTFPAADIDARPGGGRDRELQHRAAPGDRDESFIALQGRTVGDAGRHQRQRVEPRRGRERRHRSPRAAAHREGDTRPDADSGAAGTAPPRAGPTPATPGRASPAPARHRAPAPSPGNPAWPASAPSTARSPRRPGRRPVTSRYPRLSRIALPPAILRIPAARSTGAERPAPPQIPHTASRPPPSQRPAPTAAFRPSQKVSPTAPIA